MKNKDVIIVFSSCISDLTLFPQLIEKEGYNVCSLFKYDNYITVGLSQIIKKKLGKKTRRKYNDDLTNKEGTIIVFDAMVDTYDLMWLVDNNPKARCVLAIWNPVELTNLNIKKIKKIGIDVWSYGERQCKKYNIKQNLSFFCESMYPLKQLDSIENKSDICFVGKDKGRLDIIKQMIKDNNWSGYNWSFYITPDHFWQRFKKKEYKKNIKYIDVQYIQAASRAVLEILPSEDVDVTMRAIDALVLNRKLITNNKNAVNNDYYDKNNIFIIGYDDPKNLGVFLDTPYTKIDSRFIERYRFDNWIERIVKDTPVNG